MTWNYKFYEGIYISGRASTGYSIIFMFSASRWLVLLKFVIHFRGEAHSFDCFAGMVGESGAEKWSKKALSLAADDVFEYYWWYAFNTNVCFRGYVNVATLIICSKNKRPDRRLIDC
jgi:hypothetical protein